MFVCLSIECFSLSVYWVILSECLLSASVWVSIECFCLSVYWVFLSECLLSVSVSVFIECFCLSVYWVFLSECVLSVSVWESIECFCLSVCIWVFLFECFLFECFCLSVSVWVLVEIGLSVQYELLVRLERKEHHCPWGFKASAWYKLILYHLTAFTATN